MVLVFVEHQGGTFKKTALETLTYGRKVANMLGGNCHAVVVGSCESFDILGQYGADSIYHDANAALDTFDDQQLTQVIAELAQKTEAKIIVLPFSSTGKNIAGRLSVRLQAGCVSGVNSLPTINESVKVTRGVFSGKALAEYKITSDVAILSLMPNSIPVEEDPKAGTVESISTDLPEKKIMVQEVKRSEGTVPLPEAEIVVSAGRGMKGPENWGIIEELAGVLNATTACSRPVADSGWRPHHEHVGQTGIAIRPNLYIAVGISGAIQHLAGVNNSKTIVVINKDPEAPFFKAADYGVCADLFDVVPRLTESVKKFKNQ